MNFKNVTLQSTLSINSCRLIKYVVFDILCTKWEKDLFRTILLVLLVIICYITYIISTLSIEMLKRTFIPAMVKLAVTLVK